MAQKSGEKSTSVNIELATFDFLLGRWETYEKSISSLDTTVYGPSIISISKSFDGVSILENWEIKNKDTILFKAILHRVYDGTTKKWMLSYSDSDLNFQIWEGKKENNNWKFFRERYKNGKKIIVRQQWIKISPQKAQQVIERSFDDGVTWITGSILDYRKLE